MASAEDTTALVGLAQHPVLSQSREVRASLFDEFVRFMLTPSFGAHSKREIELELFRLMYSTELVSGSISVGAAAQQLTVTRSRARSLLLEARTRAIADPNKRAAVLRELIQNWPSQVEVEPVSGRLRLVIDDPFVRDLLRNHAYERGLLLDSSFASEVVSLRWSDYAALIASAVDDKQANELEKDIGAAIRSALSDSKEKQNEFDIELKKWSKSNTPERIRRALVASGSLLTTEVFLPIVARHVGA